MISLKIVRSRKTPTKTCFFSSSQLQEKMDVNMPQNEKSPLDNVSVKYRDPLNATKRSEFRLAIGSNTQFFLRAVAPVLLDLLVLELTQDRLG